MGNLKILKGKPSGPVGTDTRETNTFTLEILNPRRTVIAQAKALKTNTFVFRNFVFYIVRTHMCVCARD